MKQLNSWYPKKLTLKAEHLYSSLLLIKRRQSATLVLPNKMSVIEKEIINSVELHSLFIFIFNHTEKLFTKL